MALSPCGILNWNILYHTPIGLNTVCLGAMDWESGSWVLSATLVLPGFLTSYKVLPITPNSALISLSRKQRLGQEIGSLLSFPPFKVWFHYCYHNQEVICARKSGVHAEIVTLGYLDVSAQYGAGRLADSPNRDFSGSQKDIAWSETVYRRNCYRPWQKPCMECCGK